MIEKNEVYLTISYVDCEYVWSKPTGTHNASIGDKFLNKYNTNNADVSDIYNSDTNNNSVQGKSAASMLENRLR